MYRRVNQLHNPGDWEYQQTLKVEEQTFRVHVFISQQAPPPSLYLGIRLNLPTRNNRVCTRQVTSLLQAYLFEVSAEDDQQDGENGIDDQGDAHLGKGCHAGYELVAEYEHMPDHQG